ncbi:repeat 28 [Octopus vulgaris]|uniref:Repeat 28 n=1 Tax=Octopus vulgaris TaxID=6645 RepID=A0AA36AGL5_OCTVU|nr:repeat 28 [Octopus vulgaris]
MDIGQALGTCRIKTEQVESPDPHCISSTSNNSEVELLLQESNEAISKGNFNHAVGLYTEAIAMDSQNPFLFVYRSASFANLHKHAESLADAQKARFLNPHLALAYLQEGNALLHLGNHGDAMATFASGLAQESSNNDLVTALIDTAIKSPLKEKLKPVFQQLEKMNLECNAFVVIAVIGQELLAAGHYGASVTMLESALSIGTISIKLRGSVFSALSRAYWGTGDIDKSIAFMKKDLDIMKSMGDQGGECRVYGNLGSAFFSKGHYQEALSNHRHQLVLAMKLKDRPTAASALSNLGHVYTAIGDYPNALNSHKQCVLLCRQRSDRHGEAREIGNAGAVYLAMGCFDLAIKCHNEHLQIAKSFKSSYEEARAYSNLGSAYHYKRDYEKAKSFHNQVLTIAKQRNDCVLEARAYAGLGHAARCKSDYNLAKHYHEKQLDNALQTKDRVAEGRSCANLGIIYHQLNEYEAALKLHMMHLKIARKLGDYASEGRAYGNIGNAYSALGEHEVAMRFHKQELSIAVEVNDRHSEMSTHGNLAVSYQSLKMPDKALHHFVAHLNMARELKDTVSEARALCNLGNFYSVKENYSEAIPYYEQFLTLAEDLCDKESEAKACFNLGYAYSLLGNYQKALDYYEQHLDVAKRMHDKLEIARAYCNLGLAHKALFNYDSALDYQKKALALMHFLKYMKGTFKVLGTIGDILLKTGEITEAVKTYQQQLNLAKQTKNQHLIATAYGALGTCHRFLGQFEKAFGFHNQELAIRQEMKDLKGECRAHGSIGTVHMCLENYTNAYSCFEEQLKHSQELHDSALEAQAYGNLGIIRMNTAHFDEAIGLFEQQLSMLEQLHGNKVLVEKGKAFGNLSECYEALGDFEESVKCHDQYLVVSQATNSLVDQDKAYRGLGNAHRALGNLQQALVCFEKRLVVTHEMNNNQAKASAYGELGCLHSLLGNFEQAISCLEHQLNIARNVGDKLCEGEAACGLGNVYQQMGEYETALKYHENDLQIADELNNTEAQCRAYGNFGLSHESLGNHEEAVRYQEKHLSMAAQLQDKVAKTMAFSSLGRVHHALGNYIQAVQYLQQGLQIAEQLGRREDEAKIRYRLGLSLWGQGQLEECQQQLFQAADLFEMIRRESYNSSDYKLSLFDLQTACYQALQRVLVAVDCNEEALVVAERACTRAFIDLLLERQSNLLSGFVRNEFNHDLQPITLDQILGIVSQQNNIVLSYSIAAGFLYTWVITPKDGIIKFHQCNMAEIESSSSDTIDTQSLAGSTVSLLDQYVGDVRESIGVEGHDPSAGQTKLSRSCSRSTIHSGMGGSSSFGSLDNQDSEESWQQQLEEIGDKLNAENDRTGFLRMVNRNHILNSSNYSLSSLFSLSAGLNGINPTIMNIRNSMKNRQKDKSPITALYDLLFAPIEDSLQTAMDGVDNKNLVLVLQGDLYLVPFAMLRRSENNYHLFERFNLIIMPSITALQRSSHQSANGRPTIDSSGAIVIGNPKLTPAIQQQWQLKDIPGSEYEARIVAELLTAKPLIGLEATKSATLQQIEHVEVIHISAHISWKLSAIILSPGELSSSSSSTSQFNSAYELDDSGNNVAALDSPSLSEYLLTAADILNLKLHAKLVVLNSGHTHDRAGRINSDGVVGLTRALLSVGAECVLYSLWQVPDQASKLLMKTMYLMLQEGRTVTQALHMAIKAVQAVKQFSHPSNWGGWVLVGKDVTLSSKMALMGHAICELLQSPSQCRDSMRVLLHLIEKSLQRIHQGAKNPMYTMYQSIENKVGQINGWKDLLHSVGFRFESAANGLPVAVFFPQTDPGDRLTRASASLQALLGLPSNSITALSEFLVNYEAGEAIITTLHDILIRVTAKENIIEVPINVKLWQIPGCHEFLASLGFDLIDVGRDDVTLRLGKQATKRHLQFALQSLVAVFDTQEAPKSLALDSSSSLESLSSSHSSNTTTTSASILSNFAGTPPLSPRMKKKSLFNPAEMEKKRNLNRCHLMQQGGLVGKLSKQHKSSKTVPPDPSLCLSHQSRIKAMYPANNYLCHSPATSSESCLSVSSTSSPEELSNLIPGSSFTQNTFGTDSQTNSLQQNSENHREVEHLSDSGNKARILRSCDNSSYGNGNRCKNNAGGDKSDSENSNINFSKDQPFDRLSPGCTVGKSRVSSLASKFNKMETHVMPVSKTISDAKSIFTSANSLFKKVGKKETGPNNKSLKSSSLNPEDIALKVLADVAPQREAVEQLQKASFFQSQKQTHLLRIEQSQQRLKSSPDNCSYSSNSANSSRHASPSCDSVSSNNTMCTSIGVNRCTPSTSGSSPSSLTPNATSTAGFKNYSPESFKYGESFSPTLHRNRTEKSNNAMLQQENFNLQDMSSKNFSSAGSSFNSLPTDSPNEQHHHKYTSSSSSKENKFERLIPDNFSLLLHSYNNQPNIDLNYVTDAKPPIPAKPQLRATQNSAFKSLSPSTDDKLKLRGGDKKPAFKSKENSHVPSSFQKVVIHSQDLPKPNYKLGTFSTFNSDPLQFCSSPEYSVLEHSVHKTPSDKTALKSQENVLHTTVSDTRNMVCSSDLELRKKVHYQEGNSGRSSQFSTYVHSDNESVDSDANFSPFRQKSAKKSLDKWSSDPSVLHSDHHSTFTDSLSPSEAHEAKSTQKKVCFKEKSLSSPLVAEEFTPQTYGPLGHFYFSEFSKSPTSSNTVSDKNFSTKHHVNNPGLPSWSKQAEFSPHSKHSDKRTINQPPSTQVVDYPNQYSHHSSFPGSQTLQPSLLNTTKSEKTLLEQLPTNHKKSKILQISKC